MVQSGGVNSKRDGRGAESGVEAGEWVERYRASGLSLKLFATEHGLKAGRLHYWVYGRRGRRTRTASSPVFHEVSVPTEWLQRPGWVAEIGLDSGMVLRLDGRADVGWVRSLVKSLRRPCSR